MHSLLILSETSSRNVEETHLLLSIYSFGGHPVCLSSQYVYFHDFNTKVVFTNYLMYKFSWLLQY